MVNPDAIVQRKTTVFEDRINRRRNANLSVQKLALDKLRVRSLRGSKFNDLGTIGTPRCHVGICHFQPGYRESAGSSPGVCINAHRPEDQIRHMVAENTTATSLRLAKTMVFTERHGKLKSRRSVTFEPPAIKTMPRKCTHNDATLSDLDKELKISTSRPGRVNVSMSPNRCAERRDGAPLTTRVFHCGPHLGRAVWSLHAELNPALESWFLVTQIFFSVVPTPLRV